MAISENLEKTANSIIYLHREMFGESPSPMKVQKLCYYAQGYHLAEGYGELFTEDFEAWQHGPVVPSLWQKYRDYSWHPINEELEMPELSSGLRDFLEEIVLSYGRYDGAALSTMTHRESPWKNAREGIDEMAGSNNPISKDSLQTFFAQTLAQYGEQ